MFQTLLFNKDELDINTNINPDDEVDTMLTEKITLHELNNAVKKLKTGKASGLDQLLNEMLSTSVNLYPKIFINLFNSLLENGIFPSGWTKSMTVPLHKKGDKSSETNYRGIALSSCLGKLFNMIINNRISKHIFTHNIIKREQLGFVPGNRTSDNLMIIHSLINLYCNKNGKKLYVAFIDFEKAFDSISRKLMLQKLYKLGIRGNIYKVIENMYKNDETCIKIGDKITHFFDVNRGVKQGCILSPNIFNTFLSDLPEIFRKPSSEPAKIGDTTIGSLFWADDIIIISESKSGLQRSLNDLSNYCHENKLKVNTKKTKCMVMNKGGKFLQSNTFHFKDQKLETVKTVNYLGFLITPNLNIKELLNDLYKRGLKAYFKLKSCLDDLFRRNITLTIKLFDSLVKPILLYGADFWGCLKHGFSDMNPIEKLNIRLCKHLLGVKRSVSNNACRCELGRLQLYITGFKSTVKNWIRILKNDSNSLLRSVYNSNIIMNLNWTTTFSNILSKHGLGYLWLLPSNNINNQATMPMNTVNIIHQRIIDCSYQNTLTSVKNQPKMRTYCLFKDNVKMESYLMHETNIITRTIVSKFRLSDHRLEIEIGRYFRPPKKPEERICTFCNTMEDEIYCLMTCNLNSEERKELFDEISSAKPVFNCLDTKSKFIYLMNETNTQLNHAINKFIENCLKSSYGAKQTYEPANT